MTNRIFFIGCFIFCLFLLLSAAYLQYVEGLEPCPMCIMQRWVVILITVLLFFAFVLNLQIIGQRIYSTAMIILAIVGAAIAGRQVWLQHLPINAQPECGPGLDFLLNNFPVTEALSYIFSGSGECAKVDWTFLGQSLAMWSVVAFIFLITMGAIIFFRTFKRMG